MAQISDKSAHTDVLGENGTPEDERFFTEWLVKQAN
jgi:hypothetical protein